MSAALKQNILDFVRRDHVSLAELSKQVDGVAGDFEWKMANMDIVFWRGLSKPAIKAIIELKDEGLIYIDTCSPMIYFFDGAGLNLPILQLEQRPPFKETHWAPIVLRPKKAQS